jgi:transcriptional regulator with XRE-family HTH domain
MFNDRLKIIRMEAKLNQREMAEKLGVVYGTYNNWEMGKREPDFKTIKKIAKHFNVSTDYLLGLSNKKTHIEESDTCNKIVNIMREHSISIDDINRLIQMKKIFDQEDDQ